MKDDMMTAADVLREALEADRRIRGYVRETPVEQACFLSDPGQGSVCLKLENLQLTGSFKLRGALNRLLLLTGEERERGIVTASTGNHGIAVAYALKKLGIKGRIVVPENISGAKLDILKMYGADLAFYGEDTGITEAFARQKGGDNGQLYISPYNDPWIIGGQGTIGVELRRQLDNIEAVFVPVGGGGLAAGIAGYLKSVDPHVEIIGCQPEQSPVMAESIKAGRIVDMESGPTLADGTAGRIEAGALTFTLCRDWLDEFVLVSEEEIGQAIRLLIRRLNMIVEGAAALSLASFLKIKERYRGKHVVLVLSGSRIHYETLRKIICQFQTAS
jgi:threonine dehydratase